MRGTEASGTAIQPHQGPSTMDWSQPTLFLLRGWRSSAQLSLLLPASLMSFSAPPPPLLPSRQQGREPDGAGLVEWPGKVSGSPRASCLSFRGLSLATVSHFACPRALLPRPGGDAPLLLLQPRHCQPRPSWGVQWQGRGLPWEGCGQYMEGCRSAPPWLWPCLNAAHSCGFFEL